MYTCSCYSCVMCDMSTGDSCITPVVTAPHASRHAPRPSPSTRARTAHNDSHSTWPDALDSTKDCAWRVHRDGSDEHEDGSGFPFAFPHTLDAAPTHDTKGAHTPHDIARCDTANHTTHLTHIGHCSLDIDIRAKHIQTAYHCGERGGSRHKARLTQ